MSVDIKKLTEQQKDVISDTVQYRFYHRITERNVYEWLNNFKQAEVDLAIEILKHIDYYSGIRGTGTFINTFGTIYSLKNRYPCVA